jgi:hypothetical protein
VAQVVMNAPPEPVSTSTRPASVSRRSRPATQTPWSALDAIDDVGVQYGNVYGRSNPAENHLRLMAAVLNDAVRVLAKHKSPRRRREEMAWFTSRDRTAVFAFENVCEALGIDAARIRRHVIAQSGAVPAPGRSVRNGAGPRSSDPATLRRAG